MLESLVFSSFSPSAQKQEAEWVYAFFLQGKKKTWQRKNFFQRVSEHLPYFFLTSKKIFDII